MASDDLRRGGSEQAAGGGPARAGEGEKGIFDHLAEYLLQQRLEGAEAAAPPAAPEASAEPIEQQEHRQPPFQAPAPPRAGEPELRSQEPAPLQAPAPPRSGEPELRSQELVFAETAEQLVIEKEAVVREEVVLSRLVREHVQDINDSVRRTEVEVERITPAEAEQIARAAPPPAVDLREPAAQAETDHLTKAAPPPAIDLRGQVTRPSGPLPPRAASVQQPSRTGEKARPDATRSLAWWMWYALILGALLLIAFALGQLIGSPGG